jgi:hypothetical protein
MSRLCILCNYPDRTIIESKLFRGEITQTDAAKEIGCDTSAISRHMKDHLTPAIRDAVENDERINALNVFDAVLDQYHIVEDHLKKAVESGNIREVLSFLKEGRLHIELQARLQGVLDGPSGGNNQVNLMLDPQFIQLRDTITANLDTSERVKLSAKLLALADEADNKP